MLGYGRARARGDATPPSVYEFRGRRRDGTLVDLEASVSVSAVGGKSYITTAIRDIADRKGAEAALRRAHDELERRVAERTAELAAANEELRVEVAERTRAEGARTELLRRLVSAQEDERRRISRELHDQLGQHLTAMMLTVESLKSACRSGSPTGDLFRQLEELGDTIAREFKTLAWELRPTALDDLGLQTALSHYVEAWSERARVPLDFQCALPEERRLPPQVETALYRIIQEALTNVLKHARAGRVSVILGLRGGDAFAVVEDDGAGFDQETLPGEAASGGHLGLLGMRERVALVKGTVNIESAPGGGTTVFVRVPAGREAVRGEAG
jgi:signal transduction histidine kinase